MQDVIARPRGIIRVFLFVGFSVRIPYVQFGALLHPCHGRIVAAQLLRCECTDADERLARMHEVVIDDLRQLRQIDAIDISDGIAVFVDAAHTHLITPRRKPLKTVDAIDRPIGCLADAPGVISAERCSIQGSHPCAIFAGQKCIRARRVAERQCHPCFCTANNTAFRCKCYTRRIHAALIIAVIEAVGERDSELNARAEIALYFMRCPSSG